VYGAVVCSYDAVSLFYLELYVKLSMYLSIYLSSFLEVFACGRLRSTSRWCVCLRNVMVALGRSQRSYFDR
jgi:hypothetical protein